MMTSKTGSSLWWLLALAAAGAVNASAPEKTVDCTLSLERTDDQAALKVHTEGFPKECDTSDTLQVVFPNNGVQTFHQQHARMSVKHKKAGSFLWTTATTKADEGSSQMGQLEYIRLPRGGIIGNMIMESMTSSAYERIYEIRLADAGEQVATVTSNMNLVHSDWRNDALTMMMNQDTAPHSKSKSLRGSQTAPEDDVDIESESHSSYLIPEEYELEEAFRRQGGNRTSFDTQKMKDTIAQVRLENAMERIKGGQAVEDDQFPYFVFVRGCGGTLIGPQTVLSAAHCFDHKPPNEFVGTVAYINAPAPRQGIERTVTEVVLHPSYTGEGNMWDMVLLRLNRDVSIPSSPTLVLNTNDNFPSTEGDMLTIIGHGVEKAGAFGYNDVTKFLSKPFVPDDDCQATNWFFDASCMLCAGGEGEGACAGDSGGPLVKQRNGVHTLVGVTSWGPCGVEDRPNGFARVSAAVPWIIDEACSWNSGMSVCSMSTPSAPSNNVCASATDFGPLDRGTEVTSSGTTFWASQEDLDDCSGNKDVYTVWYKFEASYEYQVTASLCGSEYDSFVAVYEGGCGSLTCTASNDDHSCPNPKGGLNHQTKSKTVFQATAGKTYYVAVSGSEKLHRGKYELSISTGLAVPRNDDCGQAEILPSIGWGYNRNIVSFTENGNPEDPYDLESCGIEDNNVGVWYTFVADADTTLTATTCSDDTFFDTKLALFKGSRCARLTCEDFHDNIGRNNPDYPGCSDYSLIEAPLQNGEQYYLHVSGSVEGDFELALSTPLTQPRVITTEETTSTSTSTTTSTTTTPKPATTTSTSTSTSTSTTTKPKPTTTTSTSTSTSTSTTTTPKPTTTTSTSTSTSTSTTTTPKPTTTTSTSTSTSTTTTTVAPTTTTEAATTTTTMEPITTTEVTTTTATPKPTTTVSTSTSTITSTSTTTTTEPTTTTSTSTTMTTPEPTTTTTTSTSTTIGLATGPPPSQIMDTYIEKGSPDTDNGSVGIVNIDLQSSNGEARGLIKFPLPSMSKDDVAEAKLWFYTENGSNSDFTGYRMKSFWEDTSTWSDLGGGEGLHESSSSFSFSDPAEGSWINVDVTKDVQTWLAGTPNYGWIIKATSTNNGWDFTSVEGTAARRPQLVIVDSSTTTQTPVTTTSTITTATTTEEPTTATTATSTSTTTAAPVTTTSTAASSQRGGCPGTMNEKKSALDVALEQLIDSNDIRENDGKKALKNNKKMLKEFKEQDYNKAIDKIEDVISRIKNKAKSSNLGYKTIALQKANCILNTLETYT